MRTVHDSISTPRAVRWAQRLTCLALLSAAPVLAQPPDAASPAPRKPAAAKTDGRLFLAIDGGAQVTTLQTDASNTYTLYGETATLKTTYETPLVPALGARVGYNVWRRVIVGAGLSVVSHNGEAVVNAQLPHPFYFQKPRTIDGAATGITHQESVIYAEIGWLARMGSKVDLLAFAGPAFFSGTQEVGTRVQYGEQYPYDTASYSSLDTTSRDVSATGYTAGVDVIYRLSHAVRIGALIRYSNAKTDVEIADGQSFSLTLGGLQTTAGIRIWF